MDPLAVEDLLRFASTVEGERLATQVRGAVFTLRVLPAGIEITPASSGQSRLVSRDMVQRVCEEYQRSQSTRPGDYQAITFDASYLLAVIDRFNTRALRMVQFALPEEVPAGQFTEGAIRTITVNAFERDTQARQRCIAAHGTSCAACDMSFGAEYGPVAEGYIHVHHLRPLSEVRAAHAVDPEADLRPVCPNCHSVIHRRTPPYCIEEVRAFRQQRDAESFYGPSYLNQNEAPPPPS